MQIQRINHARKPDSNTHRMKADHDLTKDFKILRAGTESGIKFEAKYLDYTWQIALSPEETKIAIQNLLKE